jgi:hypothetical protein
MAGRRDVERSGHQVAASHKSEWGGKREGSGRRRAFNRKMRIGLFCETRHRELSKEQARARYEARAATKAKRKQQALAREAAIRAKASHYGRLPSRVLETAIAKSSAEIAKLGRYHQEPLKRPKDVRAKILEEAAQKFNNISTWYADECWKLARQIEANLKKHP